MAEGIVLSVLSQLSSSAAKEIGSGLGSFALKEFGSAMCITKEMRRLHQTLTAINEFLPHAENLQLSNNNVKSWLRRIKDAAYDAEDIIDDFDTETTLRDKLMAQGTIIERVCHFASSSNPILLRIITAHKIKKVREDLKDIYDDHQSFGLERRVQENHDFISVGRQTHSYIPEEKVVGRDSEREEIVKLLLDSSRGDGLSVIPIHGMGGIGKTALAQLVYNDKRVVDSFMENRMWVCVSDEFDLQKITEKIIRSGTDKECPNLDMDQLQSRLRQHLGGKRYLLVLDDIWNEERDKWEELKDLLIGGASGSKIIVTTRSEKVRSIMGTVVVRQLSELEEDDCWNLFKGRAFKEGEEEAKPELVEIGKDIAKKCAGVPLAVKTLGGLCYQAEKEMWEFVRDSDVWRLPEDKNGILRALRISYNHLPFYLKQCFAYCSIFPKDFEIHKDVLIQLWIAQRFISSVLLEDLWISHCEGMESWPDWLGPQLTSLRELRIHCTPSLPFLPESMPNITSLQYLLIYFCPNFPESMENLTSLQTLYIHSCPNLPESMGNLTSLQTLWINSCPNLQILPESMGNLTSLRNLVITSCPNLQILPWVLRVNTTIQQLWIRGCPELTRRYNKETGEDRHQIAHITYINVKD